ncbi:MAG: hypothetical protein ACP6IP_01925 [Candidatus Njordarchaeia archaeon]
MYESLHLLTTVVGYIISFIIGFFSNYLLEYYKNKQKRKINHLEEIKVKAIKPIMNFLDNIPLMRQDQQDKLKILINKILEGNNLAIEEFGSFIKKTVNECDVLLIKDLIKNHFKKEIKEVLEQILIYLQGEILNLKKPKETLDELYHQAKLKGECDYI